MHELDSKLLIYFLILTAKQIESYFFLEPL